VLTTNINFAHAEFLSLHKKFLVIKAQKTIKKIMRCAYFVYLDQGFPTWGTRTPRVH